MWSNRSLDLITIGSAIYCYAFFLSWAEQTWQTCYLLVQMAILQRIITEDLTWTTNVTSLNKKGQQHLHFLRRLKRASLPPPILTTFYRGTIESVLTTCITVWYGNCSAADRKTLQRTVNTAAKIIGAPLPSILDIYIYIYIFSRHFYPKRLTLHSSYSFFTFDQSFDFPYTMLQQGLQHREGPHPSLTQPLPAPAIR